MREAARAFRYQGVELLWLVAPAAVTFALTQFVVDATVRAVMTLAVGVTVPVVRWIRLRPRRHRCLPLVAGAASMVADGRLWAPEYAPSQLSTGEPRTLRAIAAAARRGQLRSEILAGARLLETSRQIGEIRAQFDLETRCVGDAPELRAAVVDVAAGLGAIESLLAQLDSVVMRLTHGARELPENAVLVREESDLLEELRRELLATVDETARLEERADLEGARSRANERAKDRTRVAEDRRCAYRAILAASQRLYDQADGELRMQATSWASRQRDLELARERFFGVTNVHRQYADDGTLKLGEDVQRLLFDAIQGASEAEAALKRGDDAGVQGGLVKFTKSVSAMGEAVRALGAHAPVVP